MRSTFPTGRSSSSARCRCSSVACSPGEITLIASSTSTGVLDITRTTGTGPASERPMNAVVIPAATEMISLPGPVPGLISASSAAMSCGFTVITSVSARSAASAADTTAMPYASRSCWARPLRRAAATISAGDTTPARSSPEISASPICPAPRTAITLAAYRGAVSRSGGVGPGDHPEPPQLCRPGGRPPEPRGVLAARAQRPQEEGEIGRPLGQPAHQVAVPVAAVGQVDADLRAARREPGLLVGPDSVQHLVLEAAEVPAGQLGLGPGDLDQPRVVRSQHRVAGPVEQDAHAAGIGEVHLRLGLQADTIWGPVGALAQAHP